MADDKPIIIIKKRGGHGGHHGGAWKVAYADFVTAMMAFFMVMWLVNSASSTTKQAIASYFRKPGLFQSGSGTPLMMGESGILPDAPPPKPEEKKQSQGTSQELLRKKSGNEADKKRLRVTEHGDADKGLGQKDGMGKDSPQDPSELLKENYTSYGLDIEKALIEKMAEDIKKEVSDSEALQKLLGIVDVKVDADGLNIEIMDTAQTSMFALGSARIQPEAEAAFKKLGDILRKVPNDIDIVGHTDSKPFPGKATGYSNWELSSDRANAARRLLVGEGLAPERFTSVLGRADRELRNKTTPLDPSNRRITLKMRFRELRSIDLSKDPSALNKLKFDESKYQKEQEDKIHAFTAKQLLKDKPQEEASTPSPQKTQIISLPDGEPPRSNPDFVEKDKIFGNSPVIGPTDHFANY